ncbi:hypothetical protein ODU73_000670 [Thermoclostridium stercorarium]|uniref:hypothetical protein n=1 Tax=Thermoclostridium stercorarium TaxID=1510 RepID=UPI0022492CF0|nr:hypothetical protein [Thermoclostridium stercorarium]UZQ86252.1 hypothetical protein ODU73_000670 [Thermoclostridium stercorarium]
MATPLTADQIEQVIAAGYPRSKKSNIDNVWQAFNDEYNYWIVNFENFLYFIKTFKTISEPSECPSKASAYARAVYFEVSDTKQRPLNCDAIFDCMYNRKVGWNISWDEAFSSLDGLNEKKGAPYYWHNIMKDPFSDCSWSLNACQALVRAYNNCLRVQDNSYKRLTSLGSNYYFFSGNKTSKPGEIQLGDFYFRPEF